MAKGAGMGSGGGGGGGGAGGVAGGGGGGGGFAGLIARAGGISKVDYARTGMRSLTHHRSYYAGKTPAQAEKIARSISFPVRVHVEIGRNGKRSIYLNDGRHRMTAAKEAGAKHIRARVVEYGPRGGKRREWVGVVKI